MTERVTSGRILRTHGDRNNLETMDEPIVGHGHKIGALFKGHSMDNYHL